MNPAYCYILESMSKKIPKLYEMENEKDPMVWVKLFTPDGNWTWYITEYDPEERLAFGLVKGQETELGYFSLAEIEQARGPLGLQVERDIHFKPCKLSEVRG